MTLSKGQGDIPSSPGRLILIDGEGSVGPNIQGLSGNIRPLDTIEPVLRTCECKICAKSNVPLSSQTLAQGIVCDHRVESTSW